VVDDRRPGRTVEGIRRQDDVPGVREPAGHLRDPGPQAEGIHVEQDPGVPAGLVGHRQQSVGDAVRRRTDDGRRLRLRGLHARVVAAGLIRHGDPVRVLPAEPDPAAG
jgi:hypothetical protein